MLTGLEEVADFQIIREWEKTTEFGDRAEIKTLPEVLHGLGQDGCPHRPVHRAEVPQLRALLHHPDAPAGGWKATSSSSTTTCSSPTCRCGTRTTKAASCPNITPWCSTKRTRSKTWRASISASSVSNYRFQELRRDIGVDGPDEEVRHAGAGPHPGAAGRADRAVLRPVRRGGAARGLHRAATRSAKTTRRSTRTCWRRWT